MEIIFEFIVELLLEGSIEVSSNKKISKWIRYPLIFLLVLFFLSIISLLIIVGISIYNKSILGSLIMIAIGILFLILGIVKFIKIYIKKDRDIFN